MRNNNNLMRIIIGSVIIFLGLVVLLNRFIDINFNIFSLWPIILVGVGVSLIISKRYTPGIILSSVGLLFLLSSFLHFSFWIVVWPCMIIAFGISIIFKNEDSELNNSGNTVDKRDKINDLAIFWGIDKKAVSKKFSGGNIHAIFGGIKLDLTGVEYVKNSVLDVNGIFGGVEVIIKKGTSVHVNGFGMFGGVENKVSETKGKSTTLTINANAIFGGVSIREA